MEESTELPGHNPWLLLQVVVPVFLITMKIRAESPLLIVGYALCESRPALSTSGAACTTVPPISRLNITSGIIDLRTARHPFSRPSAAS